jgi:sugar phosphate isomerase/epimerase
MTHQTLSRRALLSLAAAAPLASAAKKKGKVPFGVELYSVRDELKKDLVGTVRAVAKMGYPGVEFFGSYSDWSVAQAKDVRKLLDDLGIVCYSTHNGNRNLEPAGLGKTIELNQILGSRHIVMASAGRVQGLDGWKKVADILNAANEKMKAANMHAGYHNHAAEFTPVDGKLPIEVLAANTAKDVMLQFDVGTCISVKQDPVAWINKNPGRIRSVHCKDWSPDPAKGYKVLIGEGAAPWKKIFKAAEKTGGVEYYLIEQEGYNLPPLETIEKCLAAIKKIHG